MHSYVHVYVLCIMYTCVARACCFYGSKFVIYYHLCKFFCIVHVHRKCTHLLNTHTHTHTSLKISWIGVHNNRSIYLLSQYCLQCLDKCQPEHWRGVGIEADLEDVAVSVVGPELGHETCDHVILVREGGDTRLAARQLVEEQVLRGKQQVLYIPVHVCMKWGWG